MLVVPTNTDKTLHEIKAAPTVSVELSGAPELPPLPASRTVDGLANGIASREDGSDFSANLWSTSLPHGFGLCERRARSPYDADVSEFFEELAALEESYAQGLQSLCERLTREPDGGHQGEGGPGVSSWRWGGLSHVGRRPLCRSVQYASAQHAWSATQQAVRTQAQAHHLFASELKATVVQPLKGAVDEAAARAQRPGGLAAHSASRDALVAARCAARDESTRCTPPPGAQPPARVCRRRRPLSRRVAFCAMRMREQTVRERARAHVPARRCARVFCRRQVARALPQGGAQA
jgi:hypothetical protein